MTISHVSAEDARLTSPRTVIRDLPAEMVERTRAIICTKRNTIGSARLRQDGSIDYSETVGGDGTVTAGSALGAEMLMARKCEVSQGHMTLPLDGEAIRSIIDWIGRQLGRGPSKLAAAKWPTTPQIGLPDSREALINHLEDDDAFTLGDLIALVSLT